MTTEQTVPKAEIILHNGKIYTVDRKNPWVEAVAIQDGRFIAVGSSESVMVYATENTLVLDLLGKFVMPGLYDMHTHPDLALAPQYADFFDSGLESPTPEELSHALLQYVKTHPDTPWIYGQRFVKFTFKQQGLVADRHWLDAIISDRPVAIHDRSWGCMLVNSKALELAGINKDTPDPNNGYIEHDDITGEPNGLLVDGAYSLIYKVMPPVSQAALMRAYREGQHFQSARGVVGTKYLHVCENRLQALSQIDKQGQLTVRTEAAISWQDDIFPVARRWELLAGERFFYHSDRLQANAVKFHFDGTHESRSSYLSTPWPGEQTWRGGLNLSYKHLQDMMMAMDRQGIRVIAHCTGDGAAHLFLNALEKTREQQQSGIRHQCAHSTNLLAEDLPRFAELDAIAEFSPVGWYPAEFSYARNVVGQERWARMYCFKGVLDAGGIAVMGTDWPVSYLDPWIGFEAMCTRQNPFDLSQSPFYGEPITLEQAIEVMTINGAKAMNMEREAGSIMLGKRADLVVLDQNLFNIELAGNLHQTQALYTVIDGQFVWDRDDQLQGTAYQAVWRSHLPSFAQ